METLTGRSSELHSSVHRVISDDDLLTKILIRLPVVSILRFKSISKHWLSLIKSPTFITLRRNKNRNIEPPSGLFVELKRFPSEYNLVRLDNNNSSPLPTTFPFNYELNNVQISHSCNGLLLCTIRPFKFIVYNPSTNQFKLFPKCRNPELVKLVFDPAKSPHYILVYVEPIYEDAVEPIFEDAVDRFARVKTYSSQTGTWSVFPQRFPKLAFSDFNKGVYFDGAIHWITTADLHYKLDVNHLVLTTIKNPQIVDGMMYCNHKLFESRGCLLLAYGVLTFSTSRGQINVYEMKNGPPSGWSVKYVIDLGYFMAIIPTHWKTPGGGNRIFLSCISVGEREEDSFFVIHVFGKVILYKFMLKTVRKIYDFIPLMPKPICFQCFPFIPSLAGV